MNTAPTLEIWLLALGTLALQGAVPLALAGAAQTAWRSPRWRRVVWLAAWTALALVLGHSLAGLDRQIAGLRAPPAKPTTPFIVRGNLPAGAGAAQVAAPDSRGRTREEAAALPGLAASPARSDGTWWPAWVWLAGSLLVAMWVTLPRIWLAVTLRRNRVPLPLDCADRLRAIAERVGWRRPLRLLASPKLAGPIAFGVLRPGVAVPADFWARHTRAEQDVMLAHELAHLAARDPLWLALADALTVLLWWHPLVWWGRRQFRAASEAAADEASLVVKDGPAVLAGCLVALASQWQRRGVLGLLGMAGFRSGLGRRVERLLQLKASDPGQPAPSRGQWWLLVLGSVAALAAAITVPFWVLPAQAAPRPPLWAMLGGALAPAPAAKDTVGDPPTSLSQAPVANHPPDAAGLAAVKDSSLELTVQLPSVPGMDPKAVRVVSMDAMTRRLSALERFSRVKCEPVGDNQVRVALTLPAEDASPGGWSDTLLATVRRVIERPGRLEFRRIHPESDQLARRGECPEGFEVLAEPAGRNSPPRRYVVARDAVAGLASMNLIEAVVERDPVVGDYRIRVTFNPEGARAFTELTRASVGQLIAILLDGTLMSAPRVNEVITGSACQITGPASEDEARILAASLAHPLAWRLTVREVAGMPVAAREPILQGFNASPPQVTLEAKFLEFTDDGSQDSPLDRLLALIPMPTNGSAVASGPFPGAAASDPNTSVGQVASLTGRPTPLQPGVVVPAQPPGGTNTLQELRGDQLTWPGRDVTNSGNIKVTAVLGASLQGVLTEAQFREALTALQGRAGVDILSAPKVTTLSGRQAQIQVADIRTVITGVSSDGLKAPGTAPSTNGPLFTTAAIPLGPMLDVIPTVAADGHTIELTVIPTLTEFLGYDEPPKGARVEVQASEGARRVEVPLPRFRVRQAHTQARILDGQTLVLGGFPVEATRRTKDKVPVLGDIPYRGRLFSSESRPSVRKTLFVFVTAAIEDPAAHRVHPAGRPGNGQRP
jgi:Flp pilus assembly secretin CpaC/Zn-dependent protease with chaperone function